MQAIIFKDNKLVVMYREKAGRVYFTFPRGGLEQGETLTDCVVRECKEEFGIDIKPIKQVYTYENQTSLQHFFCVSGLVASLAQAKAKSLKLLEQTFTFQVLCLLTKCKISH